MVFLFFKYLFELVIVLGVVGGAGYLGYLLGRLSKYIVIAIVPLSLFCLTFQVWAYLLFPSWHNIPQPLAVTVTCIEALSFLAIGAGWQLWKERERMKWVPVGLALAISIWVLGKPLTVVFYGNHFAQLQGKKGEDHFCQSNMATCMPTSAATVLTKMGINVTEGEMAARCRTSAFGSGVFDLFRAVNEVGIDRKIPLKCEILTGYKIKELPQLKSPVLINVAIRGTFHVMAYLGHKGDILLIGDPLKPKVQRLTTEKFHEQYLWLGRVMVIHREP